MLVVTFIVLCSGKAILQPKVLWCKQSLKVFMNFRLNNRQSAFLHIDVPGACEYGKLPPVFCFFESWTLYKFTLIIIIIICDCVCLKTSAKLKIAQGFCTLICW